MIEAWNAMILEFLSTPSARRATLEKLKNSPVYIISIHALREEGDEGLENDLAALEISIHALREEGDPRSLCSAAPPGYFYPRPPRGGRRSPPPHHQGAGGISIHALREEGDASKCQHLMKKIFISIHALREEGDPEGAVLCHQPQRISIHALREEGDVQGAQHTIRGNKFLSTPSARRATARHQRRPGAAHISIHALREEGDSKLADKIGIIIS